MSSPVNLFIISNTLETIPNEVINLLILIVCSLFYVGIIFFRNLQKNFDYSYEFLTKKSPTRLPFFDFAKGAATLAVILIHTSFLMGSVAEKLPSYFVGWNELINKFFRFAIPVFLISSGALLTVSSLDKKSLKIFYQSKLQRIIIPYLFFSSYRFFSLPRYGNFFQNLTFCFKDILRGEVLPPFWFIPVLVQLYLLFPFLWYILSTKKIRPGLLLLFAFTFSLGCYALSIFWNGWYSFFGSWFFGEFFFFFVLGIVLKPLLFLENREWLRRIRFPPWTFFILVLYFSVSLIGPQERYYNAQFVYGPTIFLTLFYYYTQLSRFSFSKFIRKIGQNSLYFYLIHFFILIFLFAIIHLFNLFFINPLILFASLALCGFLITWPLSLWVKGAYDLLLGSKSSQSLSPI